MAEIRRRLGCAALLLLPLLAIGCNGPAPSVARPGPVDTVVVVSIDSLRADHLGCYGYPKPTTPAIDALAEEGLVFDRAYSTTSWTLPSHAALFSGLDDLTHGVVDDGMRLPDLATTLAESLIGEGIHTTGFFSGPYLHPSFGLHQGFEQYIDCTSYGWRGVDDGGPPPHESSHGDITNPIVLERFRTWLDNADTSARNFVFIHMWDVPYRYIPPEHYTKMFHPAGSDPQARPTADYDYMIATYDGEIRYTDDTLAEILDLMRQRGMLDNAAIVVLADHGEEFLDHHGLGHRNNLFEEVVRIPLLVHVSGSTPLRPRVTDVTSIIDVYPTVCELFGVECSLYDGPGRSLMSYYSGDGPGDGPNGAALELTTRQIQQTGLVRGNEKVIHWVKFDSFQYFDLEGVTIEGPGKMISRATLPEQAPHLQDAVRALEDRVDAARQSGALLFGDSRPESEIDPSTLEQLKSLGYVE